MLRTVRICNHILPPQDKITSAAQRLPLRILLLTSHEPLSEDGAESSCYCQSNELDQENATYDGHDDHDDVINNVICCAM